MTNDGSHYCNGCTSDPEIVQTVNGIGGLWSMPGYWNGNVYVWGSGDHLKAFSLTAGALSASPTSQSGETSGFPGSTPVISSNGTADGIVWVVESDAYTSSGPAILRAYDATNVSSLLYASNLTSGRDTLGPAVKFVVPGRDKRQGLRGNARPSGCIRFAKWRITSGRAHFESRGRRLRPHRASFDDQHHAEFFDLLHYGRKRSFHRLNSVHRPDYTQRYDDASTRSR